jgi:hypothetical protein
MDSLRASVEWVTRSWIGALALGTAVLTAAPAGAVTPINGPYCPNVVVNDNLRLDGDILYNANASGVCITLPSGKDLNLNGHSISCVTGTCGTAVLATAASSDVSGGGTSVIEDEWGTAIDGATTVSDIWVIDATVAIKDSGDRLKSLTSTHLYCYGSGVCVDATLPRSTDEVLSNDIYGDAGIPFRFAGSSSGSGPLIQGNTINMNTPSTVPTVQQVGATKKFRVLSNAVGGDIPFAVDNSSLVADMNQWLGNECGDTFYCPPAPTCSNGGVATCDNPWAFVVCTGN